MNKKLIPKKKNKNKFLKKIENLIVQLYLYIFKLKFNKFFKCKLRKYFSKKNYANEMKKLFLML